MCVEQPVYDNTMCIPLTKYLTKDDETAYIGDMEAGMFGHVCDGTLGK